ncbi:chorismate lyase [Chitinibacter sp. GC72]|uniref:chorismate--pyruvate lyase family protein n=1 Tax=Chitinibacter sp. GC72 TaxID=1526917 RepID=UPI0012F8FEBE|nr:chorismate lyase [Chitinibacter sp. GC72]
MHDFVFWRSTLARAPRHLRPWLSERGSLTRRLIGHFPDFSLRVLCQGLYPAHQDESLFFSSPAQSLATREVLLCSADQALVFAHSITSPDSLRRGFHLLGRTGSKPLGALLFADPTIQRSRLAFCQIDRRHPLWQKAVAAAGPQAATLWARRSFFYSGRDQLLVTEVFLAPFNRQPTP